MKRIFLIAALFAVSAYGQQAPQPQDDPIGQQLFPPEMIMGQSQKLHLDDKQRATIKTEVQRAQSKFFDLQWEAKEAGDAMAQMLQQTPIDEARVLEQADKVMGYEREIKKIHLAMLIRIKNSLTKDQIADLIQMKREMAPRR
ncbi:MAG: periplasmic heavy metal sensor [Acidobacteriota bacterium]|nr:periplasmic heavy metal sensor [Acidobacteriota bacterium]